MTNKINVLIIFANPRGTNPLRLGAEYRAVQESIKLSNNRDNISILSLHASTIHDVRRALLEDEYKIVHISGHGTTEGLILEDELGNSRLIPPRALAELFEAYAASIDCVLLNACYSANQGDLISMGVPFTIVMDGTVDDNAAIEFSRGFYDAVGAGRSIEFAYGEGYRTVHLTSTDSTFKAILLKSPPQKNQDKDIQHQIEYLRRKIELAENQLHLIKINEILGEIQALKYQYEYDVRVSQMFAALENKAQTARKDIRDKLGIMSTAEGQGNYFDTYAKLKVFIEQGIETSIVYNNEIVQVRDMFQHVRKEYLSFIRAKVSERLAQAQYLQTVSPAIAINILQESYSLVDNDILIADDRVFLEVERQYISNEIKRLRRA